MLHVGDQAPAFSLLNQRGGTVSSESLAGTRFVIYFYPKDDTPGCTREACSFRDNSGAYREIGVPVFGVSPDTAVAHERFARKFRLDFDLLVDPERRLIEAFGVWVEKSLYGRRYMGVARATFVIGADGRVERVWEKVSPDQHGEEVLNWLKFGDAAPALNPAPKAEKAPRAAKPATTVVEKPAAPAPAVAPVVVKAKPVPAAVAKPAARPAMPARSVAKAEPAATTKTVAAKKPVAKARPAAKATAAVKAKPAAKAKPVVKKKAVAKSKPAAKVKAAAKARPAKKSARPTAAARKPAPKKAAPRSAARSATKPKPRRK